MTRRPCLFVDRASAAHGSRVSPPAPAAVPAELRGTGGESERQHGVRHPVARRRPVPPAAERALDRHVFAKLASPSRRRERLPDGGHPVSASTPTLPPRPATPGWASSSPLTAASPGEAPCCRATRSSRGDRPARSPGSRRRPTRSSAPARTGCSTTRESRSTGTRRSASSSSARFMDLNNKENGDPVLNRIQSATSTRRSSTAPAASAPFIDKPWIAVDKPRLLDGVCHLTVPQPLPGNPNATVSQTVPAGHGLHGLDRGDRDRERADDERLLLVLQRLRRLVEPAGHAQRQRTRSTREPRSRSTRRPVSSTSSGAGSPADRRPTRS